MRLHEEPDLFRDAIIATAQKLGIPEVFVEKDYWVTYALYTLFNSDLEKRIVFKGGTALSKCYRAINRFSEDIDLVVIKGPDDTGNQLKAVLRKISKTVEPILPELEVPDLTSKFGMIRKTAHQYPKIGVSGNLGHVRNFIVLESSWLGHSIPNEIFSISTLIAEVLGSNPVFQGRKDLNPFEVRCLSFERTFCEKIMSLVRFSYETSPIEALRLKIRHTYDLHMLLKLERIRIFFDSPEFLILMLEVAKGDKISLKASKAWIEIHPCESLIFLNPEAIWKELRTTYLEEFNELVVGELPNEIDIVNDLIKISGRLKEIEWSL
jgi:hypothetical protein